MGVSVVPRPSLKWERIPIVDLCSIYGFLSGCKKQELSHGINSAQPCVCLEFIAMDLDAAISESAKCSVFSQVMYMDAPGILSMNSMG